MKELLGKAQASVAANLIQFGGNRYFTAGANQFRTIWVRDFCWSVPGLLKAGYREIVMSQLELILSFKSSDGRLPRGLDVINPKIRVLVNTACGPFKARFKPLVEQTYGELKPEYFGEHGTPPIDSNLLFIEAYLACEKTSERIAKARELLKIYALDLHGFIHQPAYSDWQDSAKREGAVLLTHLLLLKVYHRLSMETEADLLRQAIVEKFFDESRYLFCEFTKNKSAGQIAIDSHLLILRNPQLFPQLDLKKLYESLRYSQIWTKPFVPGVPIAGEYEPREIAWTTKLVGLRHYHDRFVWGWLTAEAYACSKLYGDEAEAQRILREFGEANKTSEFLGEIYSLDTRKPFKNWLYKSEEPFTWTSAKWLEVL